MKSFYEWMASRDENLNEWWPFSQKKIVDDKEIYKLAEILVNSPDPKIYFRLKKQIDALDDHSKKRLNLFYRRLEAQKRTSRQAAKKPVNRASEEENRRKEQEDIEMKAHLASMSKKQREIWDRPTIHGYDSPKGPYRW